MWEGSTALISLFKQHHVGLSNQDQSLRYHDPRLLFNYFILPYCKMGAHEGSAKKKKKKKSVALEYPIMLCYMEGAELWAILSHTEPYWAMYCVKGLWQLLCFLGAHSLVRGTETVIAASCENSIVRSNREKLVWMSGELGASPDIIASWQTRRFLWGAAYAFHIWRTSWLLSCLVAPWLWSLEGRAGYINGAQN